MGLAQTHAAVNKQGVVGLGGHLRHGQRNRVGKAVAAAHHKGVKGILGVQLGQRVAGVLGFQLPDAAVHLLLTERLHRQGLSGRCGDGVLDLGHDPVDAVFPHHGVDAFQNQRVANEAKGLQRGLDPGLITDVRHFLLQDPACAFPEFPRVRHSANPSSQCIKCILCKRLMENFSTLKVPIKNPPMENQRPVFRLQK